MKVYHFTLRVRHDKGHVTIRTVATDEATARHLVLQAERCPESAIRRVWRGKALF